MPITHLPAAAQAAPEVAPEPAPEEDLEDDDLEATRVVIRAPQIQFALQFSTGETVTVAGTGLIGRNPRPEPGESVDRLLRVADPSRTVSKTHLEYGHEGETFWVNDRFSGNGTLLHEVGAEPRLCEPGRRCAVPRGSRVEIGDQFFVVS